MFACLFFCIPHHNTEGEIIALSGSGVMFQIPSRLFEYFFRKFFVSLNLSEADSEKTECIIWPSRSAFWSLT